jgi:hypothetical protein
LNLGIDFAASTDGQALIIQIGEKFWRDKNCDETLEINASFLIL